MTTKTDPKKKVELPLRIVVTCAAIPVACTAYRGMARVATASIRGGRVEIKTVFGQTLSDDERERLKQRCKNLERDARTDRREAREANRGGNTCVVGRGGRRGGRVRRIS